MMWSALLLVWLFGAAVASATSCSGSAVAAGGRCYFVTDARVGHSVCALQCSTEAAAYGANASLACVASAAENDAVAVISANYALANGRRRRAACTLRRTNFS